MRINIRELLEYFDIKENTNYGDTTATISVIGEDLCAAIFKHYCESVRGSRVNIVDPNQHIPTQMKKIGRRLDRWIEENIKGENILYQAELKNWCSRAIGGVNVPLKADDKELNGLAEINWQHHLTAFSSKEGNGLNKVLIDMVSDKNLQLQYMYKKEPLLLLWHVAKPKNAKDFFFKYDLPKKYFFYNYCWVFSCSLYLRSLYQEGIRDISVEIPNAERRLKDLNRIFKIG